MVCGRATTPLCPWLISRASCMGTFIWYILASFPGHPHGQYFIACSTQIWWGKAWEILSHERCQCPLGGQRGGVTGPQECISHLACIPNNDQYFMLPYLRYDITDAQLNLQSLWYFELDIIKCTPIVKTYQHFCSQLPREWDKLVFRSWCGSWELEFTYVGGMSRYVERT